MFRFLKSLEWRAGHVDYHELQPLEKVYAVKEKRKKEEEKRNEQRRPTFEGQQ